MANRRMLSKTISYSKQISKLSEFAQLLFTWTIPHLDDFGKISGEPEVVKAVVIPMSNRTIEDVSKAIQEMVSAGLIDLYSTEDGQVITYLGFDRHQTGLNKRTKSKYPENPRNSDKLPEKQNNSTSTEQNGSEQKRIEPNITANRTELENIADKNYDNLPDPTYFEHSNNEEYQAHRTWKRLEPDNKKAFWTTYLHACKLGLPAFKFGEFASEVEQDSTIENRGAVFNKKVKDYFDKLRENIEQDSISNDNNA